jgi:hypothetical protein
VNFGYANRKSLSFKQQQTSPILNWGLWLLLLTGIAVVKLFFHELWKDEWQAWLMARDMPWDTLIQSLYYEGHPALWYLYLKVWTLIGGGLGMADDVALSLSHLLIVAIALYWFFSSTRSGVVVEASSLVGVLSPL